MCEMNEFVEEKGRICADYRELSVVQRMPRKGSEKNIIKILLCILTKKDANLL